MERLYLKEKVFSIREKFTFYDINEQIIYKAHGNLFAFPKRYELTDQLNRPKVEITRTIFSLMPEFTLTDQSLNREIAKVKKRFRIGRPVLDIWTPDGDLIIKGSFWAHEFDIYNSNGDILVSISKQWIAWGDTYELIINTKLIERHVAAAIVIALDCAYHNQNT